MKRNSPREEQEQSVFSPEQRPEIRVGVRDQDVCIALGKWVLSNLEPLFTDVRFRLVPTACSADRFSLSPLSSFTDRSVFYDDLERALRNGDIDCSVNCLEECHIPDDEFVRTVAFTSRMDSRDLLVFPPNKGIEDLVPGSRVGCYSERQRFQMDAFLPGLRYRYTSGNVIPRLERLAKGEYDALILAASDIVRLNPAQYDLIYQPISPAVMIPPSGRGIAVLRTLRTNTQLAERLQSALDDPRSRAGFAVEMLIQTAWGEPFNAAVGAHCDVSGQRLYLHAFNGMGGADALLKVRAAVSREDSLVPDSGTLEVCVQQLMGEVALIGAGTGPADLLTVRARERLRTAGVLIYDSRRVEDCLQYVPADCEIHYLGRGDDFLNRVTNAPAEMLVHAARRGRAVVRLYEGDPLLLQPGFSEAAELEKYGIRYELIPGVSDLTAVPAYLGCALQEPDSVNGTHLFSGSSRTLKNLYYSALSNPGETLMFQNAVTDLPDLVAGLLRGGLSPDTPAAVVTAATLPQQRAVYGRLGNIAERTVQNNLPAASSLLIGAQLKPNRRLSWWPPKGVLSGKTVAVVYARPQTQKRNLLAEGIRTMGGRPLRIDLLKVERRSGFEEELEKVLGLPRPGKLWILMTSVNAVRAFGDALCRLQTDRRSLHNVRFAAAHKKIADALRTVGFAADLIPAQNSPRALTDELLQAVHKTDRILQIRGSRRYGSVAFNLQTAGLSYMDIQAYATTVDGSAFEGLLQKADYLVFTSISGVLFFVKALRDAGLTPAAVREASVQLFARGGVTARSIKKYDLPLAVEAGAAGDMELLENLVDYARREPNHDSRSN